MRPLDALYAGLAAAVAAALLTPLAARVAYAVGAVDRPRERGLADRDTPRLGGLALLGAVLLAALIWLGWHGSTRGILLGAVLICAVGALDDVVELPAAPKLAGQVLAAVVPVLSGLTVDRLNIPFLGPHEIDPFLAHVLPVLGLVALMNAVNFSDGVDGLAAGVCAISAVAFSIIAFDLQRGTAGVFAALIAGACAGFLVHNFHPARVFMGDSGSNLLGYLLGCVAIQGTLKTNAFIALVGPLAILAVPFLDTGFVLAKRLRYRRRVWEADTNHFHHRFARIGFSQRRTVLYLYGWSATLAGLAVALRFVPYYSHGAYQFFWLAVMGLIGLVVLAVSLYLVLVLEILKFRRLHARELRAADPGTAEWEIDAEVAREIETGEWEAVDS
jgi:UDP-GlcNAc:undecaprenyl-phosphate GlcNAc-1-phosphate transferase